MQIRSSIPIDTMVPHKFSLILFSVFNGGKKVFCYKKRKAEKNSVSHTVNSSLVKVSLLMYVTFQ